MSRWPEKWKGKVWRGNIGSRWEWTLTEGELAQLFQLTPIFRWEPHSSPMVTAQARRRARNCDMSSALRGAIWGDRKTDRALQLLRRAGLIVYDKKHGWRKTK